MKEKIKIDLVLAQEIINRKQEGWQRGFAPFCTAVGEEYEQITGESIDPQNFGLRVRQGRLTTTVQPGKRGAHLVSGNSGKSMSAEHKARMLEGRRQASNVIRSTINETAANALREKYGKKLPVLVEQAIKGNKSAAIKLNCILCMGGPFELNYRKYINECSCTTCPMVPLRPYQKSLEDIAD